MSNFHTILARIKHDMIPDIKLKRRRINSNIPGGLIDLMVLLNNESRDLLIHRTMKPHLYDCMNRKHICEFNKIIIPRNLYSVGKWVH